MSLSDPYQFLEIGNRDGEKWDSSINVPNSHVSVLLSPNVPKRWNVAKSPNAALWSFYVVTDNNKKLVLSYEESVDDITLRYESKAGDKRWFVALLQPDNFVLLKAAGTKNRFIYKEKGTLKMKSTDTPSEHMEWLIKESFEELTTEHTTEVEIYNLSNKWISTGASANGSISVCQDGTTQSWSVISPVIHIKTNTLFVMIAQKKVNEVMKSVVCFQTSNTNGLSIYTTSKATLGKLYVSTTDSLPKYLTAKDGLLCMTTNKNEATAWTFEVQSFPNDECKSENKSYR